MTAAPVDTEPGGDTSFCENVYGQVGGAGGIWLVQDNPTDAPVCSPAGAETGFQAPVALALPCTGAFRVISIGSGPSHGVLGTIDQATGKVTYTPNAGYSGPDSFTFSAIDAGGYSQPATATIQVRRRSPPHPKPHPRPKRKCPRTKKLKHGRCVKKKHKHHHKKHRRHRRHKRR